jgi:Ca2+/Na+ antiporter
MTKRNYFQSAVIFLAALYFVKVDLKLDWIDAILLILLAIICVLHTMDVRDDWELKKRRKEKQKKENGTNDGGAVT